LQKLSRRNILLFLSLLFTLNILIPALIGGWITVSLSAAYPRIAPLQTTWYELEAVRYLEENTREKYVVIGDVWTTYAGEVIVGISNPRAYYFVENDIRGYELFREMLSTPSTQVMIEVMSVNNATVAYFIITEPRLGPEDFGSTLSKALQAGLQAYGQPEGFGNGKLYVFRYEKP
jgi:hypothetical protein